METRRRSEASTPGKRLSTLVAERMLDALPTNWEEVGHVDIWEEVGHVGGWEKIRHVES